VRLVPTSRIGGCDDPLDLLDVHRCVVGVAVEHERHPHLGGTRRRFPLAESEVGRLAKVEGSQWRDLDSHALPRLRSTWLSSCSNEATLSPPCAAQLTAILVRPSNYFW
jgi:hypothetical protein